MKPRVIGKPWWNRPVLGGLKWSLSIYKSLPNFNLHLLVYLKPNHGYVVQCYHDRHVVKSAQHLGMQSTSGWQVLVVSFATRRWQIFFAILSQSRSGRTSPSRLLRNLPPELKRNTWFMATEMRTFPITWFMLEPGNVPGLHHPLPMWGLVQQIVRNLRRRNPELVASPTVCGSRALSHCERGRWSLAQLLWSPLVSWVSCDFSLST